MDWFHAEEHLEAVAAAAFTDPAQRAAWLEPVTQALWDGQVEDVIQACQALARTCHKASQAATYFSNNVERMRYDRFRAAGYMIGSGTIESACKQIVTHRLGLPGAQWEVEGAIHTAKARAVWLSGTWHLYASAARLFPWPSDIFCVHTMLRYPHIWFFLRRSSKHRQIWKQGYQKEGVRVTSGEHIQIEQPWGASKKLFQGCWYNSFGT